MQVPFTSFGVTSSACLISLIINNKVEKIKYHDRVQIKDQFWKDLKLKVMKPGYFNPEREAEYSEEEWDLLGTLVEAQKKQGNLKQLMVMTYDKEDYIEKMVESFLNLISESTGHVGKVDI